MEHSRHKCFDNFIISLLGAIAVYYLFPNKPYINVQSTIDIQLALSWIHRTHINETTAGRAPFGTSIAYTENDYCGAFPKIIRITATRISTIPTANRSVKGSPKHKQLTTTAVTGSKAPSMAVGVLPMLLIATLIKNNDNTVGNSANCNAHNHCVPVCRTCKGSLATII